MRQLFRKVVRENLTANTMPFTRRIKYVNGKFKERDCNWVLYFCLLLENFELIPGVFFFSKLFAKV